MAQGSPSQTKSKSSASNSSVLTIPSTSVSAGTHIVGEFDGEKWLIRAIGNRETVRHSLEDSPEIKRERERSNYEFKWKVIGEFCGKIIESLGKAIKGS